MSSLKNPAAKALAELRWSRIPKEERSKLLKANRLKGLKKKNK